MFRRPKGPPRRCRWRSPVSSASIPPPCRTFSWTLADVPSTSGKTTKPRPSSTTPRTTSNPCHRPLHLHWLRPHEANTLIKCRSRPRPHTMPSWWHPLTLRLSSNTSISLLESPWPRRRRWTCDNLNLSALQNKGPFKHTLTKIIKLPAKLLQLIFLQIHDHPWGPFNQVAVSLLLKKLGSLLA